MREHWCMQDSAWKATRLEITWTPDLIMACLHQIGSKEFERGFRSEHWFVLLDLHVGNYIHRVCRSSRSDDTFDGNIIGGEFPARKARIASE